MTELPYAPGGSFAFVIVACDFAPFEVDVAEHLGLRSSLEMACRQLPPTAAFAMAAERLLGLALAEARGSIGALFCPGLSLICFCRFLPTSIRRAQKQKSKPQPKTSCEDSSKLLSQQRLDSENASKRLGCCGR